MYIHRDIQQHIIEQLDTRRERGIILTGVVGCGKTTLIQHTLDELRSKFRIFTYTGDDIQFRQSVQMDSTFLVKDIRSQTTHEKILIFVDEVQKCESIFDAIKYAHDQIKASFIISGSNPDYLNTIAKIRLQRRADIVLLGTLSLPEILTYKNLVTAAPLQYIHSLLLKPMPVSGMSFDVELSPDIRSTVQDYLIYGGFPLVFLENKTDNKLLEIRKMIERGFESWSTESDNKSDLIRIDLAERHSREFAYQGVFQKTGIRKRDHINLTIDQLINHGYLIRKKPMLLNTHHRSYLSVYSYTDPGIVSYMTHTLKLDDGNTGQRIEGLVHSRLHLLLHQWPLKTELGYFKPFTIDANDKVKYLPGEIDFVIKSGSRLLPIEVKATDRINQVSSPVLIDFIKTQKCTFGLVLYGGAPYFEKETKRLFWPYWLI